jgi:competence protein ComEA
MFVRPAAVILMPQQRIRERMTPAGVRFSMRAGFVCFFFLALSASAQKDFPEGPEKEYVAQICLQCHEPSQLLNQRKSEADWKQTVARMAQKGALATPEQYEAIAAYMAKNFPKQEDSTKVNMNRASAEEIADRIGLTPEEAKALVTYREKHGDYREWGEILVVYGVDGRKVEAARDRMSF